MGEKVYIETTVISYLTAWRSPQLLMAAHQEATRIDAICESAGYQAPTLCTPLELTEE